MLSSLLFASCSEDKDSTSNMATTNVTSATVGLTASTAEPSGTSSSNSTATESDPTTLTGEAPTTGAASASSDATTAAPPCMDPEGQTNSKTCTDPSGCGCASGHCSLVPGVGGWCGQCGADADCKDGCTGPNVIEKYGSICDGSGCETSDVCHDAFYSECAVIYEIPDVVKVQGCSSCVLDSDCDPDEFCTPTYYLPRLAGAKTCHGPASVGSGSGCTDDSVCTGGHCTEVTVIGPIKLSVCGECVTDADCKAMGEMYCKPATYEADILQMFGAYCSNSP